MFNWDSGKNSQLLAHPSVISQDFLLGAPIWCIWAESRLGRTVGGLRAKELSRLEVKADMLLKENHVAPLRNVNLLKVRAWGPRSSTSFGLIEPGVGKGGVDQGGAVNLTVGFPSELEGLLKRAPSLRNDALEEADHEEKWKEFELHRCSKETRRCDSILSSDNLA